MARVVVVGAGIVGAACAFLAPDGHRSPWWTAARSAAAPPVAVRATSWCRTKVPARNWTLALLVGAAVARTRRRTGRRLDANSRPRAAWWSPPTGCSAALVRLADAQQRCRGGRPNRLRAPEPARPRTAPGPGSGRRHLLPAGPAGAAGARGRGDCCAAARPPGARVPHRRRGDRRDAGARRTELPRRCAPAPATVRADAVVNAAGTWGGTLSERSAARCRCCRGAASCWSPSRLPRVVRHKVYSADYVGQRGVQRRRAADVRGGRGNPTAARC